MNFAIIITAAGSSQRYRQAANENKLLALIRGKPVLSHTIEQATATGMDVYVVCRPEDDLVLALVRQANVIKLASNGLGDSIAAGVKAAKNYEGWIIALGDMPLLTTASYLAVREKLLTSPLVRCVVDGKPGHPVGFQKGFYKALIALTGDKGARELLRTHPVMLLSLKDPGCLLDVDTPAALKLLSQYHELLR